MKFITYIFFFIIVPFDCFGQEELKINMLNVPQTASPGAHFNIIFEIKSATKLQDPLIVSVGVPAYWQVLFKKEPQNQINEETLRYIYTVMTPKFAKTGSFSLYVYVKKKDEPIISKKILIDVVRIRRIEIAPVLIPEYVKEGDTLRVEYLIHNLGNSQEKIKVESIDGRIELNNDSLKINPNESIKVKTLQVIKESDSNSWETPVGIKAYLKDSLVPIQIINSLPVYSTKIKKKDPYLRFPIEAGVWFTNYMIGNKSTSGIQFDIKGRGFLDMKSKHFLDFTAHGPTNINIPILGSYDVYSLNYNFKNQNLIKLGDYTLQFNNLMEFGRFGRGVRIDNEYKKLGFSGFYIQPRFFNEQKETFGGSFFLKPSPKFRISIDYMSKYMVRKNRVFWSDLVGVSTKFQGKILNWETEAVGNNVEKQYDYGLFNRISIQLKRFQLHSDYIYAGKNFYGYYNNSYLLVNNISVAITKKISIGIGNNITRINPSLDAINFNTSPYNSSIQVFSNFQLRKFSNLMLSYNEQEREDRFEPKKFYFKQDFARIAYNLNAPKFMLWYEGKYGTAQNLLQRNDATVPRQSIANSLQPQVRLFPWMWIGGMAEHQRTSRFSTENTLTDLFFYGGSLRMLVGEKFSANFSYRNNYAPDELIENRSLVDLSVGIRLKNHTFNLTAGQTFIPNLTANFQKTTYMSLKYTLRINAPIAKNKNLSNIKGQILGLSNSTSKKGIVVQLGGKRMLTDAKGNFYFNKLTPDKYYLEIDKSTTPFGVVTNVKMPLEVDLKSDSTSNIQIELIKTGGIEGKVFFEDGDKIGTNYTEKPVVLVKLFNDKESFVSQLNENNQFSFKEIKPGTWQISATLPHNQERFTVINAQQTIEIVVDKMRKTEFAVRPVERKIEFIPKTFKLVEKNNVDDKKTKSILSTASKKQVSGPISKKSKANQAQKLFDSIPIKLILKQDAMFLKLDISSKFQLHNRIVQYYKTKAGSIEGNSTSSIKQGYNLSKSVASNLE